MLEHREGAVEPPQRGEDWRGEEFLLVLFFSTKEKHNNLLWFVQKALDLRSLATEGTQERILNEVRNITNQNNYDYTLPLHSYACVTIPRA